MNLAYLRRVVSERGFTFLARYFRESILFDLQNGTRTSSRVPKEEQDLIGEASGDGLLYVASFTSVIKQTLDHAERVLGEKECQEARFVDLGCGKGKALILFRQLYPDSVHEALGIEYDATLVDLARENATKASAARIMVHHDSATNLLRYVGDELLIVYIYNSFQGDTFRDVISTVKNRPHVLIYIDPVERSIVEDAGYVLVAESAGRYNADTWVVMTSPEPLPAS